MARMSITQKVKNHLIQNPSYFKWSAKAIASKFNCSERTVSNIVKSLSNEKQSYLRSLKNF